MKSRLLGASVMSIFFLAGVAGAAVPREAAATKKSSKEIMAGIRALDAALHTCRRVDVFVATNLSGKAGTRKAPPKNDASGRIGEIRATHACGKRHVYGVVLAASGQETSVMEVSFAGACEVGPGKQRRAARTSAGVGSHCMRIIRTILAP